jgi:hypothetical protein
VDDRERGVDRRAQDDRDVQAVERVADAGARRGKGVREDEPGDDHRHCGRSQGGGERAERDEKDDFSSLDLSGSMITGIAEGVTCAGEPQEATAGVRLPAAREGRATRAGERLRRVGADLSRHRVEFA